MPKPVTTSGEKNLIADNLRKLRSRYHLSQRGLAVKLQLLGYDIDRNVISRIENGKRYVTDIELQAFCMVFGIDYTALINGDTNE